VKVGVRKMRRASSPDVTPNRRASPNLRLEILERYGIISVIPLPEPL
jgi:hypothetical protein